MNVFRISENSRWEKPKHFPVFSFFRERYTFFAKSYLFLYLKIPRYAKPQMDVLYYGFDALLWGILDFKNINT